eukprot:jgi/Ulvmu1/11801/UM080_0012.1
MFSGFITWQVFRARCVPFQMAALEFINHTLGCVDGSLCIWLHSPTVDIFHSADAKNSVAVNAAGQQRTHAVAETEYEELQSVQYIPGNSLNTRPSASTWWMKVQTKSRYKLAVRAIKRTARAF